MKTSISKIKSNYTILSYRNDGIITALISNVSSVYSKHILTIPTTIFSPFREKKVSRVLIRANSDILNDRFFSIDGKAFIIPSLDCGTGTDSYYIDITKNYLEFIITNKDNLQIRIVPLSTDSIHFDKFINLHELTNIHDLAQVPETTTNIRHEQIAARKKIIPTTKADVIVEYFNDDEMIPANETYSLAGGVEANITLCSGSVTASFNDIFNVNCALPFKISHIFKQDSENFSCGKNWRLNLHQTLEKGGTDNCGCDYIYTDANGYKHGFIETFFYLNNGVKTAIPQNDVLFDESTGKMYKKKDPKIEVFKEQHTTSGLQLTTRIEGFCNTDYFEQRSNEEKQLEDAIYSYKRNLYEYEIARADSGVLEDEKQDKMQNYFQGKILPEQQFKQFLDRGTRKNYLILQKQDAIQLRSLYEQKSICEMQIEITNKQKELAKESMAISLDSSKLENFANDYKFNGPYSNSLIRFEIADPFHYNGLDSRELKSLYYQFKLLGNVHGHFNNFGIGNDNKVKYNNGGKDYEFENRFYSIQLPKDSNNNEINQIALTKRQISSFENQINNLDNQYSTKSLNKQISQIETQIKFIKERNEIRVEELKKIYKEYINYEENLEKLYKTTATSFLTGGSSILCFNRYGELCALTDKYGNTSFIQYDIHNRISRIDDGKKSVYLEYSNDDLLKTITDFNGNRVEYSYSSNTNLEKVSLSNGNEIIFEYSGDFNYIKKVTSRIDQKESVLTYSTQSTSQGNTPLKSLQNNSLVGKITDNGIEAANKNIATINFDYKDQECTITSDKNKKQYFMNERGILNGECVKNDEEISSCSYTKKLSNKSISIQEVDEAIATSYNVETLVIDGKAIRENFTEFMFSALISEKAEITMNALITYTDNTTSSCEDSTSLGQNQKKYATFMACPVSCTLGKSIKEIKLTVSCNKKVNMIRFAPASWDITEVNEYRELTQSQSSTAFVCKLDDNSLKYQLLKTTYHYDDTRHLLLTKKSSCIDRVYLNGQVVKKDSEKILITNYSYNDKGSLIREESYIEGEENTRGILVNENILDDKGRIIKNRIYNTLESTSKKYEEKAFNDNSEFVQSEFDAFGINKISYEYDPATSCISTMTLSSGSKFTYSRDCRTKAITGISQSTEDGEANSIETHYNCGLVTKHTSGTNCIEYEYDGDRQKSAVFFNGVKKVSYNYEKNVKIDNVSTTKTLTTLYDRAENVKTEVYIDSKGNLIQANRNGKWIIKNKYSKKNDLLSSKDNVTDTVTSTDYDEINHRINSISKGKGSGKFSYLDGVNETFKYDSYGNVTEHSTTVRGNGIESNRLDHKYTFTYSSDTAKSLKMIDLPNGLQYEPQNDFMGRYCGKTLLKNNEKFLGEYISYRKVGDHTSDMISSIRYGEIRNGKYSISEGIRYKYDTNGNISEKWENGKLSAAYEYDHLSRLIREDNSILGKTWLFSYDRNGNRETKIELPFTRQVASEINDYTNASIDNYSYDGDILLSCGNRSFSYNGLGDPTTFKDQSIKWSYGQLVKFGNIEFEYDAYGKRIKKGSTYFTYDSSKILIQMRKNDDCVDFIYDDRGISGLTYQNKQYVLRKNAQGDITHIFSFDGELVVRYEYDAWGNHVVLDGNGNEITDEMHIGNMNPIRYRGYFYDTETKLYYLINRYYDPEIGRFISQDKITYLQPDVINGLNLFAYCGNNPVMRIDENGCKFSDFLKKIGNFFKKLGLAIAGVVIAGLGLGAVLAAVAPILPLALDPIGLVSSAIVNPIGNIITGQLYQMGTSMLAYGIDMFRASINENVYNDMERINWNPFNTDESKVINSTCVSFYKGIPVVRSNKDRRSFNIGAIFLYDVRDEESNELDMDVLTRDIRHEYGHSSEIFALGPLNYLMSVGIPSASSWGEEKNKPWTYYNMPWENIAEASGGVVRENVTINNNRNSLYLFLSCMFGPLSLIYSKAISS